MIVPGEIPKVEKPKHSTKSDTRCGGPLIWKTGHDQEAPRDGRFAHENLLQRLENVFRVGSAPASDAWRNQGDSTPYYAIRYAIT